MDLRNIVQLCEKELFGKKFLYVPCSSSDKLLIVLSAHNQGGRYFLARSFIQNQKYNLLFLTDPDNSWYLNCDFGEAYLQILNSVIREFSNDRVYIFGSSMAGYGALHFAITLNLNALVCNPQVNLELTLDYGWYDLNSNISRLNSALKPFSLERLLNTTLFDKTICVIHGHAPIDVANVEALLGSAAPLRKLLIYTLDTDDHAMPFGRDVEKVYQSLDLIDKFNELNLNVTDSTPSVSVLRENRKKVGFNGYVEQHRTLGRKYRMECSWATRHAIERPGVYFFSDVGELNKDFLFSGCLVWFDGNDYRCVSPGARDRAYFLPIQPPAHEVALTNNASTFENCWVRVPENGQLTHLTNSSIQALFGTSQNSYLNWDLTKSLSDLSEGIYISCCIDVELERGKVTLSLGAFGDAGYYQKNKVIDASGQYALTLHVLSIRTTHKDALFARLYFYPDGISKTVNIKRFSVVKGFYPDVLFWEK